MNFLVSVVLPVYNGEQFLLDAIESILSQSYTKFEFIIIDDGSTDSSIDIISSFNDTRINLVTHKQNKGLVEALNSGLKVAKGKYILRMDQDDISDPLRFEKQIQFMEDNPQIAISGTYAAYLESESERHPPSKHELLSIQMITGAPFVHPTVIMRKSFLDDYKLSYSPKYLHAEDYGLWVDAAQYGTFANLPEELVQTRKHRNQYTKVFKHKTTNVRAKISFQHLQRNGISVSKDVIHFLQLIHGRTSCSSIDEFNTFSDFLNDLYTQYPLRGEEDKDFLQRVLFSGWRRVLRAGFREGFKPGLAILKQKPFYWSRSFRFKISSIYRSFI